MSKIFIYLKNSKIKVLVNKKNYSILKLIESKKIFLINNQCREGFCGICRTIIINGKVKYKNSPIACINNNEILPCCCIPISSLYLKL